MALGNKEENTTSSSNVPGSGGSSNGSPKDPLEDIINGLNEAGAIAEGIIHGAVGHAEGVIHAGVEASNAAIAAALGQAQQIIDEGYAKAEELVNQGMDKAAAAVIAASDKAADAVMRGHKLADKRVREFWREAKKDLQPIVSQGRFARDEMAAMLGIRNSQGKIVEWDQETLSQTPGFKFQYEWGRRAVENSAVGAQLGGRAARALTEFGQGLASQRFDTHFGQLSVIAAQGAEAAGIKAGLATQTGGQLGQQAITTGNTLGNIYMTEGGQLANVFMQGHGQLAGHAMTAAGQAAGATMQAGATQAGNIMQGSVALANNHLAAAIERATIVGEMASAGANLQLSHMMHEAEMANQRRSSRNSLFGDLLGGAGGILTGIAAIGSMGSDVRLKKNIEFLGEEMDVRVYTWEWKDPDTHYPSVGVLAHEVELIYPEVVSVDDRGYKKVNYKLLVERMNNG
jgi:hypothetical protein